MKTDEKHFLVGRKMKLNTPAEEKWGKIVAARRDEFGTLYLVVVPDSPFLRETYGYVEVPVGRRR